MRALVVCLLLLPGVASAAGPLPALPELAPQDAYERGRLQLRSAHETLYLPTGEWPYRQNETSRVFVVDASESIPYLGSRPVDDADFYEVVGERGLATSLRVRRAIGLGLAVIGGAAMLGGGALAVHGQLLECTTTTCVDDARGITTSGLWLAGSGVLALIGGGVLGIDFRRGDRPAMARAYNRRLRESLHLPALAEDDVFGGLVPVPGGAMLALGYRVR